MQCLCQSTFCWVWLPLSEENICMKHQSSEIFICMQHEEETHLCSAEKGYVCGIEAVQFTLWSDIDQSSVHYIINSSYTTAWLIKNSGLLVLATTCLVFKFRPNKPDSRPTQKQKTAQWCFCFKMRSIVTCWLCPKPNPSLLFNPQRTL